MKKEKNHIIIKLYLHIPFYIFTYESKFSEYNNDHQRLQELKQEFERIVARLDTLVEKNVLTSFDRRLIMELSEDVIHELAKKYDTLKQEVGEVMCGALIETESRKIHNEGREEGREEGRAEEREKTLKAYAKLIDNGCVTMEELEDADIDIEQLEEYMEKNGMEIPQPGKSR